MSNLEKSVAPEAQIRALQGFLEALEAWNGLNTPSVSGYVMEPIGRGHPVHAAAKAVEQYYDGMLPLPARLSWKKLLRLTEDGSSDDDETEAEETAYELQKWTEAEIARLKKKPPKSSGSGAKRGRKKEEIPFGEECLRLLEAYKREKKAEGSRPLERNFCSWLLKRFENTGDYIAPKVFPHDRCLDPLEDDEEVISPEEVLKRAKKQYDQQRR